QSYRRDRNADLETDQVPALVQARVASARIGTDHVFAETVADVLGFAFEDDKDAEADVVADRRTVALERGNHLDLSLLVQHAALSLRAANRWNLIDRRRRIGKPVGRSAESRRVAHRGALDRRFRSVEEGVEHLGIEPADSGLLGREPVVPPYCFRR